MNNPSSHPPPAYPHMDTFPTSPSHPPLSSPPPAATAARPCPRCRHCSRNHVRHVPSGTLREQRERYMDRVGEEQGHGQHQYQDRHYHQDDHQHQDHHQDPRHPHQGHRNNHGEQDNGYGQQHDQRQGEWLVARHQHGQQQHERPKTRHGLGPLGSPRNDSNTLLPSPFFDDPDFLDRSASADTEESSSSSGYASTVPSFPEPPRTAGGKESGLGNVGRKIVAGGGGRETGLGGGRAGGIGLREAVLGGGARQTGGSGGGGREAFEAVSNVGPGGGGGRPRKTSNGAGRPLLPPTTYRPTKAFPTLPLGSSPLKNVVVVESGETLGHEGQCGELGAFSTPSPEHRDVYRVRGTEGDKKDGTAVSAQGLRGSGRYPRGPGIIAPISMFEVDGDEDEEVGGLNQGGERYKTISRITGRGMRGIGAKWPSFSFNGVGSGDDVKGGDNEKKDGSRKGTTHTRSKVSKDSSEKGYGTSSSRTKEKTLSTPPPSRGGLAGEKGEKGRKGGRQKKRKRPTLCGITPLCFWLWIILPAVVILCGGVAGTIYLATRPGGDSSGSDLGEDLSPTTTSHITAVGTLPVDSSSTKTISVPTSPEETLLAKPSSTSTATETSTATATADGNEDGDQARVTEAAVGAEETFPPPLRGVGASAEVIATTLARVRRAG